MEAIHCGQDFTALVDYAHTDDALGQVLQAVRELEPRRLILMFGCGGDRDRSKRPRMAQVAEEWADVIIVTNDNPRTESPEQILADIRSGFSTSGLSRAVELPDRREAIACAIDQARAGEVVLIAGKGHEPYQLIGEKRFDFDDRLVASEIIMEMSGVQG